MFVGNIECMANCERMLCPSSCGFHFFINNSRSIAMSWCFRVSIIMSEPSFVVEILVNHLYSTIQCDKLP